MSRLPTVVLERKVPGGKIQTRKVNQTDYARDINKFVAAGWTAKSWRRGDSPDDVVEFAAKQALVELERARQPGHIASKDKERAFKSRSISINTEQNAPKAEDGPATTPEATIYDGDLVRQLTEAAEEAKHVEAKTGEEMEKWLADAQTTPTDWRAMPWFSRKKYIKELTGQTPKNAQDAERIMGEHGHGDP